MILGMQFLSDRKCVMTFGVPVVSIGDKENRCTDRHGRHLLNDIQVVRWTTLAPATEQVILARVTTQSYCPVGMVEGVGEQ